jgi:hypothetical protein
MKRPLSFWARAACRARSDGYDFLAGSSPYFGLAGLSFSGSTSSRLV